MTDQSTLQLDEKLKFHTQDTIERNSPKKGSSIISKCLNTNLTGIAHSKEFQDAG